MPMFHPDFLAAINRKRNRIFVLAVPDLSAIKINGVWRYCLPLSDIETENFQLVTNVDEALSIVKETKKTLGM